VRLFLVAAAAAIFATAGILFAAATDGWGNGFHVDLGLLAVQSRGQALLEHG
jgi:hypothetical protein